MKTIQLLTVVLIISNLGFAQKDSVNIEELRTQSGVDPTRVTTKLVYSVWYYDQSDNRSQIHNRINFTVGINRWSFGLKPEVVTKNTGVAGEKFETKSGDIRFSMLNAFYIKGKHAWAGAAEFTMPTGAEGFGSQYFSVNPSLTYSYTFNPSLFFAIQPQYTFHIAKNTEYPDISVLTVRPFLAKFFKSGWLIVLETRTINDFQNKKFDIIISPIIGKSLGSGFNLTSVVEIPAKQETIDNRGVLIQTGIAKNF